MFNKYKLNLSISFFMFFIIFAASAVLAHGINLDAYVEGNKIIAEASFSDGSVIKNAEVKVYDGQGHLLSSTQTDENGIAEFEIPALEDLKLVLNDKLGHQAENRLERSELPADLENKELESESTAEKMETTFSEEELRTIVSEELDKQLSPLKQELNKMNNSGPGITEIIGGIGYIFGLMGLYLYFKKREN